MLHEAHLVQDGDHGDVGLARPRGRADQDVLVAVEGRGEDAALDPVQLPAAPSYRIAASSSHEGLCAGRQAVLSPEWSRLLQ